MDDLRITLVQSEVMWKNVHENLLHYTALVSGLKSHTDLILLPEMFQTGFCSDPETVAETMDGETVRWMKRTAESLACAVAGTLVIRENRRFYNRLVYIDQHENLTWYDKRHLFRMAGEEEKYTTGMARLIVPLKGWQISFQVCYDLRFPVWSSDQNDYDVLINLANWPGERRDVWNTLLRARAIENQSYVAGVNRIGIDGKNVSYTGDSTIIDPKGIVIGELKPSEEGLLTRTLSWNILDEFRKKFPVWKDRDNFEIKI
jgi:omega-amidase